MILGGNQPYFMPYIGYWQLINAADVYVVMDDYNFIKRGWISRNRILINGKANDFRIEVLGITQNRWINQHIVGDFSSEKKIKQLYLAYKKAFHFEDGIALMEKILLCKEKNLSEFLLNSIHEVCRYLDIQTRIIRSSEIKGNADLKREFRIYDMCQRLGADTYYNAIGGQKLYTYDDFKKQGIKLGFISTGDIRYKQFNNDFVPNLSIIDVIMFNSKEEIRRMLDNYTVIKETEGYDL